MTARLLALAALALVASGCVSVEMGRMGRQIAADVERQPGAEVGRGYAIAFGRGTIGTGRFLGRLVAPQSTEPFRRLAGNVSAVKVAHYPIAGPVDARALGRPDWLARIEGDGWIPLVTVRDPAAFVTVHYRDDAERVTDLLVVTLADDDLVLTKLSGDLTALVLDAIAMGTEVDVEGRSIFETAFGAPDPEPDGTNGDAEADTTDQAPPSDA